MPWSYHIDGARRIVFSRVYGVLTDAGLEDHHRTLMADPAFDPDFGQVFDCSDVARLDITMAYVRRLADRGGWSKTSKRAIVAPQDVVYGSARLFQAYYQEHGHRIKIFRTRRDALDWLGVDDPA